MPKYLTEINLKEILQVIKPTYEFIHDKIVPNSKNKRMRPDFRCEELKLIIEFDGDSHYCKAERILKDKQKDDDYINLGYKIFRIPYFIQMSTKLLKIIFDEDIKFTQIYPNGFIDKKATLPADFCELGIELFIQDLEKFDYCKDEIIESLKKKIEEKENMNFVVPSSLFYLLRNNKKVYKYLHENRIDDILISNTIRFTQPQFFNDPFELKPYIEKVSEMGLKDFIKKYELLEKIKNEDLTYLSKLDDEIMNDINKMDFVEFFNITNTEHLGILSLSKRNDNLLMWAHYANEHKGFVVEFDYENNFFNQNKNNLACLKDVAYTKYRPHIELKFNREDYAIYLNKSFEWKYEEELRMFLELDKAIKKIDNEIYLFKFPKQAIKSIYMGCLMKESDKKKILKILTNDTELSHIKLYDLNISEKEFILEGLTNPVNQQL